MSRFDDFRAKVDKDGAIPDRVHASDILNECPYCGSNKLHKKELNVSTFLHSESDGNRVWIMWTRHRYECKNPDCEHKTFDHPDFNVLKGKYMTKEASDTMASELIQDPDALVGAIGEKYGQSKYASSRFLRNRIKEFDKNLSYLKGEEIYFLPFTYTKGERCALVGIIHPSDEVYLLDIFDKYESKIFDLFSLRLNWPSKEIEAALCKFDVECLAVLYGYFPRAAGVVNRLLIDSIEKEMDIQHDRIFFERRQALEYLKDVVSQKDLSRDEYHQGLDEWYEDSIASVRANLLDKFQISLKSLRQDILSYEYECWRGTKYDWRREFDKLYEIIKTLHKRNNDFDLLCYRMLHANKAAIEAVDDELYTRCVYNFYAPITRPFNGVVGVNINELYDEIVGDKK